MNQPSGLERDAEYAHAVFDLCGIKVSTHGERIAPLPLRAHMFAELAGVELTTAQVEQRIIERRSSKAEADAGDCSAS